MLAIQAMISVCVLALGVMMPAVAKDLAIDPKLVGIFTAIIYGVAAVLALFAAGPIVRLGAVRVCQFALLMAAIGLAFNALGAGRHDGGRRHLHRRRARPDQPGLRARPGAARAARMVRHRVLDQADRRADRLRPGRRRSSLSCWATSAGAAPAWLPPAHGPRGDPDRRAAALAHRRRGRRRPAVGRHLAVGPLRAGPRPAARARAGRPSSTSSPSTPSPSIW